MKKLITISLHLSSVTETFKTVFMSSTNNHIALRYFICEVNFQSANLSSVTSGAWLASEPLWWAQAQVSFTVA